MFYSPYERGILCNSTKIALTLLRYPTAIFAHQVYILIHYFTYFARKNRTYAGVYRQQAKKEMNLLLY